MRKPWRENTISLPYLTRNLNLKPQAKAYTNQAEVNDLKQKAETKLVAVPAKYDPMEGGKLLPHRDWYNMEYQMINGLLLKNQACDELCRLIKQGVCEDLGDAIRQGIIALLIDKARYLMKDDGIAGVLERIRQISRPGDMKPGESAVWTIKCLQEMYAKIDPDQ